MKAIFDNLTMGAGRQAEWDWDWESAVTAKADSIEIEAWAAQRNTLMHITDWVQAKREDPELEAAMYWCLNDKKKGMPWVQQLENWRLIWGL